MTEMPHGRQIKGSLKNLLARRSPNKLDCMHKHNLKLQVSGCFCEIARFDVVKDSICTSRKSHSNRPGATACVQTSKFACCGIYTRSSV